MASIKPNCNANGEIISYRFRACIGRDERRRQKFATRTEKVPAGMTPKKLEREMQRRADEWEEKLKKGYAPVKRQTLQYFVDEVWWPVHVLNGEHKVTTVDFYKSMLGRILERFGGKDLEAIKAVDVDRFLNDLRAEGLSPSTLNHYRHTMGAMFSFAETHDLIERNPMRKVAPVKSESRGVDFLAPEDAKKFLEALENAPTEWRCMMSLMIFQGLRRGETVGLRWSDFDFDKSTVSISRAVEYSKGIGVVTDTPKSSNSIRVLPLAERVIPLLHQWKLEQETSYAVKLLPSAYVFASKNSPYEPMFPTAPTRWLSRFVKANNLPDVSPHDLRHTCGSLMLASGASVKDVQDFLGHEDASTTLKFYAGSTPETLRNAVDGMAASLD